MPRGYRQVRLGEKLDALVAKHLKKKKMDFSAYVRTLIAADLGKPELADEIRIGRPRHDDE